MGNGKNLNQSSDLLNILSHTFDKVKEMADANSVLGEKIEVNNMTIIPVSKVSVGFAGGGADIVDDHKNEILSIMKTYIEKYYDEIDDQQTWFEKIKELTQQAAAIVKEIRG